MEDRRISNTTYGSLEFVEVFEVENFRHIVDDCDCDCECDCECECECECEDEAINFNVDKGAEDGNERKQEVEFDVEDAYVDVVFPAILTFLIVVRIPIPGVHAEEKLTRGEHGAQIR